ncbi:Hypothetical predicted protein, partial [Pelobates cultripes]
SRQMWGEGYHGKKGGTATLRHALPKCVCKAAHFDIEQRDFILEGIRIILTNNFFWFQGTFYLQIRGTAMGTKFAPSYANLFMAYWEETHVFSEHPWVSNLVSYRRYIDDIFFIWNGSCYLLEMFLAFLSSNEWGITFKFLLKTKKKSCHHKPWLENAPKGQFLRIRRNCTNEQDFIIQANIIKKQFLEKGYEETKLTKDFLLFYMLSTCHTCFVVTYKFRRIRRNWPFGAFSSQDDKKAKNISKRLHEPFQMKKISSIYLTGSQKLYSKSMYSETLQEMESIPDMIGLSLYLYLFRILSDSSWLFWHSFLNLCESRCILMMRMSLFSFIFSCFSLFLRDHQNRSYSDKQGETREYERKKRHSPERTQSYRDTGNKEGTGKNTDIMRIQRDTQIKERMPEEPQTAQASSPSVFWRGPIQERLKWRENPPSWESPGKRQRSTDYETEEEEIRNKEKRGKM